jgi:hypothetical protein
MLPTNRQAPGLLSFFGVKNGGKNPLYGMDQLLATVDLFSWLLADPLAFKFVTGQTTLNLGTTGFLLLNGSTVPPGSARIFLECSASSQSNAGTVLTALSILSLDNTIAIPIGPQVNSGVGNWSVRRDNPLTPFILPAGYSLGLRTEINTTTLASNVNFSARVIDVLL